VPVCVEHACTWCHCLSWEVDPCLGRYVELVQRGTPDFIEIKGVTFCGGSRSELSMSNVPWHEEVRAVLYAVAVARTYLLVACRCCCLATRCWPTSTPTN
jgi:wyosine [tRNA(Phe)-imidazoG37] synthetase (radical SAM superfamily)